MELVKGFDHVSNVILGLPGFRVVILEDTVVQLVGSISRGTGSMRKARVKDIFRSLFGLSVICDDRFSRGVRLTLE